jgi:hypothetical protein
MSVYLLIKNCFEIAKNYFDMSNLLLVFIFCIIGVLVCWILYYTTKKWVTSQEKGVEEKKSPQKDINIFGIRFSKMRSKPTARALERMKTERLWMLMGVIIIGLNVLIMKPYIWITYSSILGTFIPLTLLYALMTVTYIRIRYQIRLWRKISRWHRLNPKPPSSSSK